MWLQRGFRSELKLTLTGATGTADIQCSGRCGTRLIKDHGDFLRRLFGVIDMGSLV